MIYLLWRYAKKGFSCGWGVKIILYVVRPLWFLDHYFRHHYRIFKYIDTNPDKIIQLSVLYLERDNPIHTAISFTKNDLFDLKTIRNAAAHISSTSQKQLNALASRLFNRQMTGTTVSDVGI